MEDLKKGSKLLVIRPTGMLKSGIVTFYEYGEDKHDGEGRRIKVRKEDSNGYFAYRFAKFSPVLAEMYL